MRILLYYQHRWIWFQPLSLSLALAWLKINKTDIFHICLYKCQEMKYEIEIELNTRELEEE